MVILYIILFAFINVMFYIRFNKTHLLQKKTFSYFLIGLAIICVLHISLLPFNLLMKGEYFFKILALSIAPIIIYLWFNKLVMKRVSKLTGPGDETKAIFLKVLAVMCTMLIPFGVFLAQVSSVIDWNNYLNGK